MVAGRVSAENQAPLEVSGRTASEGVAFLFNLVVRSVIGVCACVTLRCAQRGTSREIIAAAEQLRSFP